MTHWHGRNINAQAFGHDAAGGGRNINANHTARISYADSPLLQVNYK